MAISLKTVAAWGNSTSTHTIVLLGSPAAGDRYFIWEMWKPFSATCTIPSGWTQVTEFTDGSVASGVDVGSTKIVCYYRDWQSGDTNPVGTITGGLSVACYTIALWTKASTETWDTPSFATAAWPASTSPTVDATSTVTVGNNSVVMCGIGLRSDNASTFTRSTTAITDSGAAVTWNGNYVESPATHIATATGNDMAADLGYRLVTTGAAGVTLRTTGTQPTAETGAVLWLIQGVTPIAPPAAAGYNYPPQAIHRATTR